MFVVVKFLISGNFRPQRSTFSGQFRGSQNRRIVFRTGYEPRRCENLTTHSTHSISFRRARVLETHSTDKVPSYQVRIHSGPSLLVW